MESEKANNICRQHRQKERLIDKGEERKKQAY